MTCGKKAILFGRMAQTIATLDGQAVKAYERFHILLLNVHLDQPNDAGKGEDCVIETNRKSWHDDQCYLKYTYVCKRARIHHV